MQHQLITETENNNHHVCRHSCLTEAKQSHSTSNKARLWQIFSLGFLVRVPLLCITMPLDLSVKLKGPKLANTIEMISKGVLNFHGINMPLHLGSFFIAGGGRGDLSSPELKCSLMEQLWSKTHCWHTWRLLGVWGSFFQLQWHFCWRMCYWS